jgi:hypothetical protein
MPKSVNGEPFVLNYEDVAKEVQKIIKDKKLNNWAV